MSGGEIQALCLGKKSRDTDGDTLNDTAMLLVGVLVTYDTDAYIILSIIFIKNEKLLSSNNNRSKPEFFRLLWDVALFKLFAYLLNMICLKLRIVYQILHIKVLV